MSRHALTEIYDESTETYSEDPDADADADETLPDLREEEAGKKLLYKRVAVSNEKVHIPTPRERHDATLFKYDSLRKPRKQIISK